MSALQKTKLQTPLPNIKLPKNIRLEQKGLRPTVIWSEAGKENELFIRRTDLEVVFRAQAAITPSKPEEVEAIAFQYINNIFLARNGSLKSILALRRIEQEAVYHWNLYGDNQDNNINGRQAFDHSTNPPASFLVRASDVFVFSAYIKNVQPQPRKRIFTFADYESNILKARHGHRSACENVRTVLDIASGFKPQELQPPPTPQPTTAHQKKHL